MRSAAACLAMLVISPPAVADPTPLLYACRVIDEPERRLACYDRAAGRAPDAPEAETAEATEPTAASPAGGKPAWATRIDTSQFTDEQTVYLTVRSDRPVACRFGRVEPVTLFVRCLENTTALFLDTHCFLSDIQGYGDVDIRLDEDAMRTLSMAASTDNSALGLWRGGSSIPVVRSLFGKERLIMRFTPFNESPLEATFDITGLETAIDPLRKACNW